VEREHLIMDVQGGIRVAVVGVGYWGSKHLRVLNGLPEVRGVVAIDPRLPAISDYRHLIADGRGFTSLEAALPSVDAVVVATHPASHAQLGLQALAAGKHVLVEKPLATTTADAEALVGAAETAGAVLMVGHTFEHNPAVWAMRDLVQSEEFGRVYFLESQRLNLGLYQSDVNVVFDLAPHDISIANFILGSRPTSVTTWGSRHVHPTLEDNAQLRLEYGELGVVATIHVSWLHPQKVRRTVAVGANQMAVYDDLGIDERIRIHDKSVRPPRSGSTDVSVSYRIGDVVSPVVDLAEPLAVQDSRFVRCALTGSRPVSDGRSGLAVVHVLEAAQQSLLEHRTIDVPAVVDAAPPRIPPHRPGAPVRRPPRIAVPTEGDRPHVAASPAY
jgi:predicted dehydrogenase